MNDKIVSTNHFIFETTINLTQEILFFLSYKNDLMFPQENTFMIVLHRLVHSI